MVELPDFDSLKWLAQHAPQQLATLQKNLNQALISEAHANNRAQLETIRHHLEFKLSRCSTPYARSYMALRLMNDKFITLNQVINQPDLYTDNRAKVLCYPGK
ncbi:DUF3135 domain-containing protein [Shewanella loihica]|uniref:DUF3135 domain-containing protein n=1 Tax=Shewanella loihica (strain ATCC BAA-1088 / PV-4) TaxID=323850 RepID=A3QFH0_SHELP|nr:DUF3135 domain-containing protein [Shewanella loihica]ABO24218.1 hypothetical protein Shew_2352 [Shewanella loihica PV-4]